MTALLRTAPSSHNTSISPAFEQGAVAFLDALVHRHPQLELASWTRLPYVSSGGVIKTHTYIDMALMAFRVKI